MPKTGGGKSSVKEVCEELYSGKPKTSVVESLGGRRERTRWEEREGRKEINGASRRSSTLTGPKRRTGCVGLG